MTRADRASHAMREYWEGRARANPVWYVDTSLSYDEPDMERFFASGEAIVAEALDATDVAVPGSDLAVEIGSGLGRICRALSTRFRSVIGVDISPTMVEQARDLVRSDGVSFVVGDGHSLPCVGSGSADLVLSFTVFQHVPSLPIIEAYVDEAARVLRPGGVFVFQWNGESGAFAWRVRRAWLALLQRSRLRPEPYLRNAPEFLGSRISVRRIERLLRSAGLTLVTTKGTGSLFSWAWARRT